MLFDGNDSFINCGTNQRGITTQVTAEAWVKTSSADFQFVSTKYQNQSAGDGRGFEFAVWYNGQVSIFGRIGDGVYLTSGFSTTRVHDGKWHHIAGVVDNNKWMVYVDGVMENSNTYSYPTANLRTNDPLVIGKYNFENRQFFDGEMDEIRVWRTARTQAQIRESMCHKFVTAPADLVAYYRFDETTGTVATDAGSQPTNGTLRNFSSQPRQISGAAIGDRSVYSYPVGTATAALRMLTLTGGDTVMGTAFSAQTRAAHLYMVDAPPTVPVPGNARGPYFGLYTAGLGATYIAELHPANCRSLYQRADNSAPTWAISPSTTRPHAVGTVGTYRGEYAWNASSTVPALIITGDSVLCAGRSTTLTARSTGATFRWNTGSTTATARISQPGTYSVAATYPNGCVNRGVFVVKASTRPTPFSLGPDTTLCGTASLRLVAPTQSTGTRFEWSDGSTGQELIVRQPGVYSLRVLHPCDTLTASIRVGIAAGELAVPNIITPNNDGMNETFVVNDPCGVEAWTLEVYTRWGRQVYQSAAYANDWAAPSLAAGTYYYYLRQPRAGRTVRGWVDVVR